jgi:predicted transcriptional regulator of viral defense system
VFPIFNINIVQFYFKNFDSKRFHEWQQKGYLQSIIKGWYAFTDKPITEHSLFKWSNTIRKPSYISLITAFSYYGFVPEQSFEISAVSSLKTIRYSILNYSFTYNTIDASLLFGYHFITHHNATFNMASLEKAILDYLYLNANIKSTKDIEALRWNRNQIIDWKLFDTYLSVYENKKLNARANIFKKYML